MSRAEMRIPRDVSEIRETPGVSSTESNERSEASAQESSSAGATFWRRDGGVWTTDKDGLAMNLLAAEITARTGIDPGEHYRRLTAELGTPCYKRIDAPATPEMRARLAKLSPEAVTATMLAGERITAKLAHAPGNNAPIGGVKIVARSGWFAARPSGTENVYKLYAESFIGRAHLEAILDEARDIVSGALSQARDPDR
jgi:phosphoglucomutase